jgi:tetratricopeptide (TPR) repeat protein
VVSGFSRTLAAAIFAIAVALEAVAQSAIQLPPLDNLEPAVSNQIREQHQAFLSIVNAADASNRELAEAHGSLAQVLHAYEIFEPAEAAYVSASRLAPRDGRWPHLLGYLYQQTGRLEEAADTFIAARRIQPDDHAVTVRLGEVYLRLNRLRDAREQFQSVVDVFPALAQSGLGEIALRERRFEDAIDHLRAALERVPAATSIHYRIAMAYRGLGRLDQARSHLRQRGTGVIRIGDPVVDALQGLIRGERGLVVQGRRAYESGQFREAADAFERAVHAAPGSATPRVNLGLARLQLGDAAAAIAQFEAALRLDPANAAAHSSLGQLLAQRGRDREAIGHLEAAFEQSPGEASVSRALSGALVRLGRDDEALRVLERAASANADDEELVVSLSILLADRARYRDAVTLLDRANRRLPDRTAIATTLARLLASSPDASLRDGRRALEIAMSVHASDPAPVHAETVALALAELGRCEEARNWMMRAIAEARRMKDDAEAARLERELARYKGDPCRR